MKRMISKLRGALLVLLLFAVAPMTANSQEKPTFDVNALAAKGEAIVNADPLAVELRNLATDGDMLRGLYIGMAAAEGHTLPGPGKQRTHDSLSRSEQGGFNTAVAFSLERNRNADLDAKRVAITAAKGAAIARVDPIAAAARTVETDVRYGLGFDIATGIFGDPSLGAQGNTATGPGSLGLRNSLSDAGQRGFNASMNLHIKTTSTSPPRGTGGYDLSAVATPMGRDDMKSGTVEAFKAMRPFIEDVQVRPDIRDVIISFTSTQKTPPLIEIGKVAPAPDQMGILAFAAGSGAFSRFVPGQNGTYSLDLGTLGEQLDIGRRYYYIINVFNDDKTNTRRPREQVTGKFTTLPQTAKVIFTEIYIFPFSLLDRRIEGKYLFSFAVNSGRRDSWGFSVSDKVVPSTIPFPLVLGANPTQGEILIANSPDNLRFVIEGVQFEVKQYNDNLTSDYLLPSGPWSTIPGANSEIVGEAAFSSAATGTFDLSAYPGDSVSVPFSLISTPPTKGKSLPFEIKGRIEVTRH